jgi:hypothetical protein
MAMLFATCGSSSSNSSSGSNTTTVCPFSGSTTPQHITAEAKQTTLTKASPSTAGCIDNVTFSYSPAVGSMQVAYDTPAGTSGAVLVITMANTTLGSAIKTGTIKGNKGLNYVQSIDVSTESGAVKIAVTLDKERPFTMSGSQVPPERVLAVG